MAECLICQAKFDSDGAGSMFFVACDRCHEAQDETHRFGVCPACRTHAAIGRAVIEEKRKLRRAFGQGHVCDATAICQGIVDMIEARGLTDD